MIEHGEKNPHTNLYWNNKTKKWLKRPVRESVVGLTAKNKLTEIKKEHPDSWTSYGWLPIAISLQDIKDASVHHWKKEYGKFDIDRALSLSTLIIINRCKVTEIQKRKPTYNSGYVNLHSNDLMHFVGSNYKKYITFFQEVGYIGTPFSVQFNAQKDSFCPHKFSKLYKWQPRQLVKENDHRIYHRVEYQSERLLLKLFKAKQEKRERILKDCFRLELKENTYKVAEQIDVEGFTTWALSHPGEFRNSEELNTAIVKVNSMKLGDLHITSTDQFGERFHSGFTNTKKELRDFIILDGKPAHEVDLKSSQFFFFACLVLYPNACIDILRDGMSKSMIREICLLLKQYYDNFSDFKEFIDASLNNSIYQYIMSKFDNIYSKEEVKAFCFRAFFSRQGQSREAKGILKKHFPNVVRACGKINNKARKVYKENSINNKLNDPIYSIPQLLQRLESRTMIDIVALQASKIVTHAFTTVHDSFLCSTVDADIFKSEIKSTFKELGLPVPAVNIK